MEPYQLYVPQSFQDAPEYVRAAVANGCGASGWKVDLVPDSLYRLDVSEVCDIHDWMYHQGETLADKDEADRVLLNNLLRKINAETSYAWLRWLRRKRALKYYQAVAEFGGPAFWSGKNDA
ncbi:MAG: hypothetical protein OET90_04355, partial [Desulfuromonadales bacterium]|nr:hypothetical protein [Desulfuromonadales bacterium]